MQKITPTLILTFTLSITSICASASSAKWTRIFENSKGTAYVDFEKIREKDGYVYFWSLVDYLRPTGQGILSSKAYIKGDCTLFRVQNLRYVHYIKPMGRDTGRSNRPVSPKWRHPPPVSLMEVALKSICKHISSSLQSKSKRNKHNRNQNLEYQALSLKR